MTSRSTRRMCLAAICAVPTLWTAPGQAEDWAREVSGWKVGRNDDTCLMAKEYQGHGATTLILRTNNDAAGTDLVISNHQWSTITGQTYDLQFDLQGHEYRLTATGGEATNIRRGFWTPVTSAFLADLGQAAELKIAKDDVPVAELSLTGSAAASAVFERCRVELARDMGEHRRNAAHVAHIPADPFASPDRTPAVSRARSATPVDQSRWGAQIQMAYPPEAVRDQIEGRVGVRVVIGGSGQVTTCEVSYSSGSGILDDAACAGMLKYARFNPALDADGAPTESSASTTIVYQLDL